MGSHGWHEKDYGATMAPWLERDIMTPSEFHNALMSYCSWANCSITSWYRTPKRNERVGGHPNSRHLVWLGADVAYDEPIPPLTRRKMATTLGLKLVIEGDHDHIQTF